MQSATHPRHEAIRAPGLQLWRLLLGHQARQVPPLVVHAVLHALHNKPIQHQGEGMGMGLAAALLHQSLGWA